MTPAKGMFPHRSHRTMAQVFYDEEPRNYLKMQSERQNDKRKTEGGVSDWHVIPVNDLRDHESSGACWCKPHRDDDEPDVWVHNSMDRREHTIEKGVTQ